MSSEQEIPTPVTAGTAQEPEPLLAFADAVLSANQREQTGPASEVRQYVTFFLRDTEYAIPILQCREIVRLPTITRVPEAPVHVRGVVNLRGHIVPAVDMRNRLGLEPAPATAKSRLIVVEVAGRLFALIVDRVARVVKVTTSEIEPAPEGASPSGATGLARVGDSIIHLMDADRVLRAGPMAPAPITRGEEA